MTQPETRPSVMAPERARIAARSETRQRNHQVLVRLDDEEMAVIREHAQMSSMTVPEYLRRCADAVALIEQLQEARNG